MLIFEKFILFVLMKSERLQQSEFGFDNNGERNQKNYFEENRPFIS